MKIITYSFSFGKKLLILGLFMLSLSGFSQNFTVSVANGSNPTSNTFEIDVILTVNAPVEGIRLASVAFGINYNTGILNGGLPCTTSSTAGCGTWIMIPGTRTPAIAGLNQTTNTNRVLGTGPASAGHLRATMTNLTGAGSIDIAPGSYTLGRYRFTNTVSTVDLTPVPFVANSNANLWIQPTNTNGATNTIVSFYPFGQPTPLAAYTTISPVGGTGLTLSHTAAVPYSLVLNGGAICATSGTSTEVPASCAAVNDGSTTIAMLPIPTDLTASYVLDGGTPTNVTLTAGGTFQLTGLAPGAHTLVVTGTGCATPVSVPFTITANPTLTPTFTQVDPICNGGTLTALPTTSINGVTGTWDPALNNTATTTYTFTPTIGQCATTATMTIVVNQPVTPTFTVVRTICNGDTLTALPTISNNAITGTWAPALNNTATTTYTFTPTVGQCATSTTVIITVTPITNTTTTVTSCVSYLWAVNGTTYTTSGIYVVPVVLQSGIFNTLATWNSTAAANGATVSSNALSGLPTGVNPTNVVIGGVNVSMSAPGGLYSSGTFIGTNISSDPLTISFNPAVYGASGNFYLTNISDNAIAGNLIVTYSDGTIDSQAVTADTDFFGYFKNAGISSIVIAPVITIPAVNRWVSVKNLNVAVEPLCQTETLDLTITPGVIPTFTQVAPICSGDALAALPTTSNNAITGTWAPAIDNTATTTYTFTPDVGQCSATATMTITVNPNVTPTFTQVAPICNGGTLAALPTTSNNAITGTWAPAIDNTATTTYTFTPTAGQCATTATMTITVNPIVTPTFTQVAPICNGGTLVLLPTTSNNAVTGTWAPALNNTATTTYTFTPTIGQCATTTTMTIVVNPITNTTTTIAACDTYTWAVNGTTYTTSGIYVVPVVLQSGIFNTLATWTATATASAATVSTNTLGGLTVVGGAINLTLGGVAVNMTAPVSGMYAATTFVGTNSANQPLTMTFNPPVYGVSGNYYVTNSADAVIAGTLTVTYSDGTVDTQAVTADTDFFGYFKATAGISSVVLTPALTTPNVNRFASLKNLRIAVTPLCQTQTLDLTITPSVTPTFTQVAPICNGGALAALPTTSNNAITGTWAPAINNTATTTYTFTPTVGQCATTATMTITVNPNVTPTFTQVAPICNGGTLTALPTTSTNAITGTWAPALNNTATTTYTFTPTAGQCATTATMTITVNTNVTPTFTQVAPICSGTALAALPTTSGNGITGTWAPAINNTATTTYTFTPTAGQCATTATMTITVNTAPTPTGSATQSFSVVALNDATIASLVVSPAGVIWYGSLADAQSATNPLASTTVLTNGATYWAVNVVGGCASTPFAVTVTVTLGNDEFNNLNFAYYPNPTSSTLNITYSKVISEIQVTNMLGQVIMTKKTNEMDVQVDLSTLAEATYFVKVTSEGKEKIIKIIKKD